VEVELSPLGETPVFTMGNNPGLPRSPPHGSSKIHVILSLEPLYVVAELAALLSAGADWKGTKEDLTSLLWAYVKKNKLQVMRPCTCPSAKMCIHRLALKHERRDSNEAKLGGIAPPGRRVDVRDRFTVG